MFGSSLDVDEQQLRRVEPPVRIRPLMVRLSRNAAVIGATLLAQITACSMKRLDLVEEIANQTEPSPVTEEPGTQGSTSSPTSLGDETTSRGEDSGVNGTSSEAAVTSSSNESTSADVTTSDVDSATSTRPGTTSPGCPPHLPYYNRAAGACTECLYRWNLDDPDVCPEGFACEFPTYRCLPACTSNEDCRTREVNPQPVCDKDRRSCRGCGTDFECEEGWSCFFAQCVPPNSQ
jgi:hypothetical protein